MEYIVDFQAYKKPINDFVIKEIAILNINEEEDTKLYILKPPFEWNLLPTKYKVENKWLENHYLNKKWSDGAVEYGDLVNILKKLSEAKTVYVKGSQKYEWLKKYLNNVYNLETSNMLNLAELRKLNVFRCNDYTCKKHNLSCALCNVNVIFLWFTFFM